MLLTNFLENTTVKAFKKYRQTFVKVMNECIVTRFLTHCVYYALLYRIVSYCIIVIT